MIKRLCAAQLCASWLFALRVFALPVFALQLFAARVFSVRSLHGCLHELKFVLTTLGSVVVSARLIAGRQRRRFSNHGNNQGKNRVKYYSTGYLFLCVSAVVAINTAASARADAAPIRSSARALIHADVPTQRFCIRHRHGDYWHSCSDMRHPVRDQSHSHTGLATYYASAARFRSSGFYFGVKSGSMDIDVEQSESGLPKGVVFGIGRGEYAIEFEASATSVSAESTAQLPLPGRPGFDSTYSTRALYGVRRIGEVFYTKMKVGLSQSRYKVDGLRYKDNNGSAGVGFGLRYGTILLESEYTLVGSKATFFSISASIVF